MSIAQSPVEMMLPITNPDTAQEFYADRLGLPFEGANDAGELMFQLEADLIWSFASCPPARSPRTPR